MFLCHPSTKQLRPQVYSTEEAIEYVMIRHQWAIVTLLLQLNAPRAYTTFICALRRSPTNLAYHTILQELPRPLRQRLCVSTSDYRTCSLLNELQSFGNQYGHYWRFHDLTWETMTYYETTIVPQYQETSWRWLYRVQPFLCFLRRLKAHTLRYLILFQRHIKHLILSTDSPYMSRRYQEVQLRWRTASSQTRTPKTQDLLKRTTPGINSN